MFKLYKSKGIVNNSFVSDIPAATALTEALQVNGKAVQIASGEVAVAVEGVAVAGILAHEPGGVDFGLDEQGNSIGGPAYKANPTFMPVGREMIIEADIDQSTPTAIAIGDTLDISTGGLTLNPVTPASNDFKVLKILEGGTNATKVAGVFTNPTGYFA